MKYIFLDIDGTLYSPKLGAIPESAKEAIKLARLNGNKVFLCTGRTKGECGIYINNNYDGYIMGAGSQVMVDGEIIYTKPFDKDIIEYYKEKFKTTSIGYSLASDVKTYCDDYGYSLIRKYFGLHKTEEISEDYMRKIGYYHIDEYNGKDLIYKVATFAENNNLLKLMDKYVIEGFVHYFTYKNIEDKIFMGELMPEDVNKAVGISKIMEYYNADIQDSFCVGDSSNDIQMIKKCSVGVAMGNATKEVKEVSDYITDDILENGLYNAFKHFNII